VVPQPVFDFAYSWISQSGDTALAQSPALQAVFATHNSSSAACFAEGARIATADGEIAVEALREGDVIVTHDGRHQPVRWIGHRRLDLARHPNRAEVEPIRIHANALADGVPRRDLRISPDHALLLDRVLVPARLLINGASIVRETRCRRVTYYHVELDTHDVLLAEGAPAESYLNTGNRGDFEDAGAPLVLHPVFADGQAGRVARSCVPFVDEAAVVEPIWRQLADRAADLGFSLPPPQATTDDPGLTVRVGARVFRPLSVKNGNYLFMLPAMAGEVRLVSRAAAPTALRPWLVDSRVLGVAIRRITLRDATGTETISPDHPGLIEGWWAPEQDNDTAWRWSNGDAVLPVSLTGPVVAEIETQGQLRYPVANRRMAG
jgi:hypothetical protein